MMEVIFVTPITNKIKKKFLRLKLYLLYYAFYCFFRRICLQVTKNHIFLDLCSRIFQLTAMLPSTTIVHA